MSAAYIQCRQCPCVTVLTLPVSVVLYQSRLLQGDSNLFSAAGSLLTISAQIFYDFIRDLDVEREELLILRVAMLFISGAC
jgi:uncharacterized membrane protein YGL010W